MSSARGQASRTDLKSAGRPRGIPGKPRSARAHEAIMNATIDMLREVGYHGLTFEGVAARSGSSKATVYRWWPTKSALTIDAVTHRVNAPPIKVTGDTRTDVRAMVQASYDVLVDSPLGVILPALAVDLPGDPDAAEQLAAYLEPRRKSIDVIISGAVARGDLPADVDKSVLLDIYTGAILYRSLVSRRPTDTVVDQLTELLLDGKLPRRPTTPQAGGDPPR